MSSGTERSDEQSPSHAGLRGAPPPGQALRWVCGVFGPGSKIVSVRHLLGGCDHAVHGVVVATRFGAEQRVVLRRWVRPGWELTDPDCTVDREALALRTLAATAVPAPTLVATDADARHCDVPALLMTWLPGAAAAPQSQDREPFLRQLAERLFAFDEHAADTFLRAYRAASARADGEYHPYWDLRTVVDLCPEPAAGPLSVDQAQRLERYMARALAEL